MAVITKEFDYASVGNLIHGVEIKKLVTWPDDRGFFRELIRHSDPFFQLDEGNGYGQWSHSKMGENTIKAWHFHHKQTDWWYCGIGVIHTVLYDLREESPTHGQKIEIRMGDSELDPEAQEVVVRIPPGVAHGLKVMKDPTHLFYITSHIYDPNDEGRHPFNSPEIPHSWGDTTNAITSERDRKLFIPKYDRVPVR